jgi:hypothetical protein
MSTRKFDTPATAPWCFAFVITHPSLRLISRHARVHKRAHTLTKRLLSRIFACLDARVHACMLSTCARVCVRACRMVEMAELRSDGDLAMLGWSGPRGATGAPVNWSYPLTDTMSTVRLLGGWAPTAIVPFGCCAKCTAYPSCVVPHCCDPGPRKPGGRMSCCNELSWSDVAYRDPSAGGGLGFRWNALFDRLDAIVANGIRPIVVLDNVDYVFVHNTSSVGTCVT